jgi:hypothetical protein
MLLKGIFWTNIKKHGFIRGAIGGYLMYPSIVIFLIFELLFLKKLSQVLHIFNNGAQLLDKDDFVSYGRININDYSWFDRMNCHYCAYANGVNQMISTTLGLIGECNISTYDENQQEKVERLLAQTFFFAKPVGLIGLGFVAAFSKLLGYKKADLNVLVDEIKQESFGSGLKNENFKSIYQNVFKLQILFRSFQHTLSIIESNWCPLTYANKKFLLAHQEGFISSDFDDVAAYILKDKSYDTKSVLCESPVA